ncbi:hypothetical protein [Variovorax paradoxus]|uniref:hypothetical protein n=1 Tax=Variovorax paradoxus TaxID=34073 RepID=UPI0029C97169|nr:hypothetical protein [Variovorax paradoxus]WPH22602.1 hypothetical protein RZE78_10665 [Variovorax paradoxus]
MTKESHEAQQLLQCMTTEHFMTTASMVSTISGAIAGVFAGILARSVFGLGMPLAVISGALVFVASILLLRRYHLRAWAVAEQRLAVRFPDGADG